MPRDSLRQATVQDLGLLVRHSRKMFEETGGDPPEELDRLDQVYRRWARARLRSGRTVAFIAETADGTPASSGVLWLAPSLPRPHWNGFATPYLMAMYTEPALRGKGFATRIVREAIQWCRAHGHANVTLHASDAGKGIYLWEGFRPTTQMRLRLDAPAGRGSAARLRRPRRRRARSR